MFQDEKRMTFTEHLAELRTRIIHTGIAFIIAFVVCYIFSNALFYVISRPLVDLAGEQVISIKAPTESEAEEQPGERTHDTPPEGETVPEEEPSKRTASWTALNPLEPFLVRFKLAGYAALLVTFPIILWHICAFVFPGLRPIERRVILILLVGCGFLAVAGVAVAYFGVFPLVLPYLMQYAPEWVSVQLRMNETISIIIKGLAGFAIAFQFPMAVLILVYMGLLTPQTLRQYRKLALVGMAFISAFLTPPDIVSMGIMMLPLVFLYELSILLSYIVVRKKKASAETDAES